MFFVFVPVLFCNLCNNFFAQYQHTYEQLQASHGSHMKGISAVRLQATGCRSQSRGCALYRDASQAAYVLGPPPSRGGDLELESGVNVSL